MKVNWFHLMPYRWLPENFRERYRSVWVDIPSTLWDGSWPLLVIFMLEFQSGHRG